MIETQKIVVTVRDDITGQFVIVDAVVDGTTKQAMNTVARRILEGGIANAEHTVWYPPSAVKKVEIVAVATGAA